MITCKALSNTGVLIPEIGLGTSSYHGSAELLRKGMDAGALFIDTAESYGTEPVVGQAVAAIRRRVFVATKVSPEHFRFTDVLRAADKSLERLGTDWIDLYQLHRPNAMVPIEETLSAMEQLVDAGKVRFIGVSNFSDAQLERARRATRKHPIVSNQVRYNVVDRSIESGLLEYCQTHGITIIAHSPFAHDFRRIVDCDPAGALASLARSTGKTMAQVAINWCLCKEGVVVIPRSNNTEHLLENCGASSWRLTVEQLQFLDRHIRWRRRGRFESFLRNTLPPTATQVIGRLAQALPRDLRRRMN